jgi:hypothetical protein
LRLGYEAMLGVKRPLHASAYEPLTPFKPFKHQRVEIPRGPYTPAPGTGKSLPAPLGDTHFGDGSPTLTEPLAGRTVAVVPGGDLIHGKLHDD